MTTIFLIRCSLHYLYVLSFVSAIFSLSATMGPPHYPTESGRSYSISPIPPAGSAIPLGGMGTRGLLPCPTCRGGYYSPGFNRHGQPSPHGPNGPAYAPQLYRGSTYHLPMRLGDAPMEYDYPPPVGAPNDPTLSFGGEGPSHNDRQHEEQALCENTTRSHNQPQPSPQLEEENAQLREELFELQQELKCTKLKRTQARERAEFYRQAPDTGRGYHPYPQSAHSASGYGTHRERSPGTSRSRAIDRAARWKVPPPIPTLTESTSAVHSEWANQPIQSHDDWQAMRRAIIDGNNVALRYLMYLNTKAQQEPKHLCTPSIQDMLVDFNGLVKRDDVAP